MGKAYTFMIAMRNAHSILFRNPEEDCLEELGTGSRMQSGSLRLRMGWGGGWGVL
jgi:hypothetical protein